MAARVFSVSTSDSPFDRLVPEALMETASAPRSLRSDLETGPGSSGSFEKEGDDEFAVQRVQSLERLLQRLKEFGAFEDLLDLAALERFDPKEALWHGAIA